MAGNTIDRSILLKELMDVGAVMLQGPPREHAGPPPALSTSGKSVPGGTAAAPVLAAPPAGRPALAAWSAGA